MSGYYQLPPRIAETEGRQLPDKYGNLSRLRAIQSVLAGRNLGQIADIGGNAGYFCLSLVDSGFAQSAVVYEISTQAIEAGRALAERMGLSGRVTFVETAADIGFLKSMPKADTIICLNFLHHAGDKFDIDRVASQGWASYAHDWLKAMREKASQAIFGIGFENRKPKHWDASHPTRPAELAEIMRRAGWSIKYDANVHDLRTLGIDEANGRYTTGGARLVAEPPKSLIVHLRKRISRMTGLNIRPSSDFIKLSRYHLYILE